MNIPLISLIRQAGLLGLVIILAGCATARQQLDLGVRLERTGDYDAAVEAYTRAIEMEPGNGLAYYNRACAEKKQGALESALADFSKAIELQPGLAAAFMGRAHILFSRGDYAEAIADFTRTIALVPDHGDAYLGRGIACRIAGDEDLALADFNKAVGIDPYSSLAFMSRGNLKAQNGDFNGALKDFIRIIQLDPRAAVAHYNSGIAREQTGDIQGAMKDYKNAAELSPEFAAKAKSRLEICASRLPLDVGPAEPDAASGEEKPADPFSDWESSPPENRGPESGPASEILAKAVQTRGLSSLIIVRGGRLLMETYFDGQGRHQVRPVRAVTKGVLSLLLGIALREKMLRSLDQPLADLSSSAPNSVPGMWKDATLRKLIDLGAGPDWVEKTEWEFQDASPEVLASTINIIDDPAFGAIDETVAPPTEIYQEAAVYYSNHYHQVARTNVLANNTGFADVLSMVLSRASGLSTLEFADRFLFKPLGIIKRRWGKIGVKSSYGSAGLFLRPLDMAKLGQILARKGVVGGRENVPSGWIEESLKPRRKAKGRLYGIFWQLETWDSRAASLATGIGGQAIVCLPEQDIVIVTTGAIGPQDTPESLQGQTEAIFHFIRRDVLPSLFKEEAKESGSKA